MIVSVHQPNLFPWLGFFDKMEHADVFILLDNVQFTKRGYQNRVQVKGSNQAQWLTVPVKTKGRYYQLTREVKVNNELDWRRDHLRTLVTLYGGSQGFSEIMPLVEELYTKPHEKLTDLTVRSIELIKEKLEIGTALVLASDLDVAGSSSELIAGLVEAVGGTTYLSGPSGKEYLNESEFAARGISLEYRQFAVTPYAQRFGSFIGGLSALDYLFNEPDHTWWKMRRMMSEGCM